MRPLISSIDAEYRRYKALGEGAIGQLGDAELSAPGPNGGNSIARQPRLARHGLVSCPINK